MTMLDNVDINGFAYDSYGFVRLGEEMDDNEMKETHLLLTFTSTGVLTYD